eukprot:gene2774-12651_t
MEVSPEHGAQLVSPAEQPVKKKRGRPPKNPQLAAQPPTVQQPVDADPEGKAGEAKATPLSAGKTAVYKRRALGGGGRQKISKAGPPLIPHVMVVPAGEDVVERLKEVSKSYGRSLCLLAATGTLSTATLMQVGPDGEGVGHTLKTNGVFTVLSISGAVLQGMGPDGKGRGKREPMIFLTASLANPTGGVMGGQVAGALEAAGPVTLVVGHWEPDRESNIEVGSAVAEPEQPEAEAGPVELPHMPQFVAEPELLKVDAMQEDPPLEMDEPKEVLQGEEGGSEGALQGALQEEGDMHIQVPEPPPQE